MLIRKWLNFQLCYLTQKGHFDLMQNYLTVFLSVFLLFIRISFFFLDSLDLDFGCKMRACKRAFLLLMFSVCVAVTMINMGLVWKRL